MFLVVIWNGNYRDVPSKTVTHATPYRQVARQYLKLAQSKGLCGRIIRDYDATNPRGIPHSGTATTPQQVAFRQAQDKLDG